MICQQCGARNREGELICAVCGALNVPPTLPVDVEAELGTESRAAAAESIAIDIGSHRFEFPLYDGLTISIGRGNRHTRQRGAAILDLEELQGYEKGVSRRHAFIRVQDSAVLLADLGSTNGTYLNGRRLSPYQEHILYDGDCLYFGLLEAHVRLA